MTYSVLANSVQQGPKIAKNHRKMLFLDRFFKFWAFYAKRSNQMKKSTPDSCLGSQNTPKTTLCTIALIEASKLTISVIKNQWKMSILWLQAKRSREKCLSGYLDSLRVNSTLDFLICWNTNINVWAFAIFATPGKIVSYTQKIPYFLKKGVAGLGVNLAVGAFGPLNTSSGVY